MVQIKKLEVGTKAKIILTGPHSFAINKEVEICYLTRGKSHSICRADGKAEIVRTNCLMAL